MFSYNRNVLITGGNFTNVETRPTATAWQKLQEYVAPAAFHNSGERFDPPKCHPQTRVAVLQRLMDWTIENQDSSRLIMWLYGAAGAGKSAIAQTMAERCDKLGLLASFFFGRSDSNRNHAGRLFPTIAYQIASAIPEVRIGIEDVIERDPLIFTRSFETQAMSLVVAPLKSLNRSGYFNDDRNARFLIIIDGLDECGEGKIQTTLLDIITDICRTNDIRLKFLIASRATADISHRFNSRKLVDLHLRLPLNDVLNTNEDVRRFLEDSFAEIKANHLHKQFIPALWPPSDKVKTLIRKSSGQFIYAAVAMNYIASIHDKPTRSLDIVLGLQPAESEHDMPFAELDALYDHILTSVRYKEKALPILASIILRPLFDTVEVVRTFLGLEEEDLEVYLADMGALLSISADSGYIKVLHASFPEFLFDSSRSGPFYLDAQFYHTKFAIELLQTYQHPSNRDLIISSTPDCSNCVGNFYEEFFEDADIMETARQQGILHHLKFALRTADLRKIILDSNVINIFNESVATPPPYLNATYLGEFLPRYLIMLNELKFDNAQEIYANFLHLFDDLLVYSLDVLSNSSPFTFFMSALALWNRTKEKSNGEYNTWHDAFSHLRQKYQDPLTEIRYNDPEHTWDIFCSFLADPNRSRNYVMNGDKYALAAVFCFESLIDEQYFRLPPRFTGHDYLTRRNAPWTWRQLVKLNHRFRKRTHLAKAGRWRVGFRKRLDLDAWTPIVFPYPRLREHWGRRAIRSDEYAIFLEILPSLLRKADRSDQLLKLVHRSFASYSLWHSRKHKKVCGYLYDYIKRVSML